MTWKDEFTAIEVEEIDRIADFPIRDEAYVILRDRQRNRYAFAWGPLWPDNGFAPLENVEDGECGILWFETEEAARAEMERCRECFEEESRAAFELEEER